MFFFPIRRTKRGPTWDWPHHFKHMAPNLSLFVSSTRGHYQSGRFILIRPRHRLDAKNFAKIFRFPVTSNL
jgi:hypothetical protein